MNRPSPAPSPTRLALTVADGVEIAFAIADGCVTRLAEATIDGVSLIAPGGGRLPHLQTRDGWVASRFRLIETRPIDGGVEIRCAVLGRRGAVGSRLDVFEFPYLQTPRFAEEEIGTIDWWFAAEQLVLANAWRTTSLRGFAYGYRVALRRGFHQLLDAGTWELGGDPNGATLLSQHMHPCGGAWTTTLAADTCYTTAECFRRGSSNGGTAYPVVPEDPTFGFIIPIQAQLRGAGGALVDCAWRDDAFFCTFFRRPGHYRTLVERRPGEAGVGYLDHHWFALANAHETAPKSVLIARVHGLDRAGAIDLWTDVHDHVGDAWRDALGAAKAEPVPAFGIDQCGGAWTDHGGGADPGTFARWEERFAELARLGFREFMLGGLGRHRGRVAPMESNMCQPWDYTIVEELGGPAAFARFCERAHVHGIRVRLWIGFQLSDWAPARRAHPEWRIDFDSGLPWDGGYRSIATLSLRRGFGDWLRDQLLSLKRLGLDGVFIDSYHNLGMQCIDWGAADLAPQSGEVLRWQAELERLGLDTTIESVGPVGLTHCGLWREYTQCPELAYRTGLRASIDRSVGNCFEDGMMTTELAFRMLANKAVVGYGVRDLADKPWRGEFPLPPAIAEHQALYNRVRELMITRRVNADGSIAWSDGATAGVLFAVGPSATVPDGYTARGIFGASGVLAAGTHRTAFPAAWRLERI